MNERNKGARAVSWFLILCCSVLFIAYAADKNLPTELEAKTVKNYSLELGVFIGNDKQALGSFETLVGRPVDGVLGYTGSHTWEDADPGWQIANLGTAGRDIHWSIPLFPEADPLTTMREVADGQHQDRFATWAAAILAFDTGDDPIYIRTTWELGGEWFYWTEAAQADPEAYKEAFQKFAAAFHGVSPRFKMVWDIAPDRGDVEQWYPGDEVVDVISQDVYWHDFLSEDAETAFQQAVDYPRGLAWLAEFARSHGKPIAISEWGVPGSGPRDGGRYIDLLVAWMREHEVIYADYWDATDGYDGLLSDGDPALAGSRLRALFQEALDITLQ
jgi:hypothetical protein